MLLLVHSPAISHGVIHVQHLLPQQIRAVVHRQPLRHRKQTKRALNTFMQCTIVLKVYCV